MKVLREGVLNNSERLRRMLGGMQNERYYCSTETSKEIEGDYNRDYKCGRDREAIEKERWKQKEKGTGE